MALIRGLPPEVRRGMVSLDIEIYKQGPRLHRPTGSFACLSIGTEDGNVYQVTDTADIRPALERVNTAQWVMHNALYDLMHLKRWAPIQQLPVWDTMLIDQDLWGGYYTNFALDDLSRRWLDEHLRKEQRDWFIERESMTKGMAEYAAKDAAVTLRIAAKQKEYIAAEDEAIPYYWDIDEPCIWAVMDFQPARVNVDAWLKAATGFAEQAEQMQADLGINVMSPLQVKKALRAVGFSAQDTEHDTLVELEEGGCALAGQVIAVREMRKAASTYGESWIEKNVEAGGLVYAGWRITGAKTGRMACRNPNLQNIPIRRLPIFRSFFIPLHKDWKYLVSDVGQQEPRVTAYCTKDKNLLAALKQQASDVYQPIADALDIERQDAKAVFLGATYGLTKYGLAKKIRCSEADAERLISNLFKSYPMLQPWINEQRLKADRVGFVRTPTGRRSWVNPYSYQKDNNAINSPIQGGAADMTKYSVAWLHHECKALGVPFPVCQVIHDEKDGYVIPDMTTKEAKALEVESWRQAAGYVIPGIPIKVKVLVGKSWAVKGD